MIVRPIVLAVGAALIVLGSASPARSEKIGVYDAQRVVGERSRLESKSKQLWQAIYEKLLTPDERTRLGGVRLLFPTLSEYNGLLEFYSRSREGTVTLPIHSLLLLEDVCTAYAWLYFKGYSAITINEYGAVLKHRGPEEVPSPLPALGIPSNALADKQVDDLSLRFRNSAFAFVLTHEIGHILYQHLGNRGVAANVSRANEREADEFALNVLRRDRAIPIGAILFFQMTAFTSSPTRFDFSTVEEWQRKLREATHPVTSDRVRAVAAGLRNRSGEYGANRETAVDTAGKLAKIATEMDDPDWHLYFRNIGQQAPLSSLYPRIK
ncbi:MAG: M48 family metalloprotease [Blastocatellia bacterium]